MLAYERCLVAAAMSCCCFYYHHVPRYAYVMRDYALRSSDGAKSAPLAESAFMPLLICYSAKWRRAADAMI